MRSGDFANGPESGKALQLAPKFAAFPGQRLVVTANYNRLESNLISAHFEPADLSLRMHRPAWPAKRSA